MDVSRLFSPKQLDSFKNSNAKINIWQGAVRSGKTFISLWRFLKEIALDKKGQDGEMVIIARTYDSIKRNLVPILQELIGGDAQAFWGKREMMIWGRRIHLVGAEDERAESKIRGATFIGAYVDEVTILPESVFKMLVSRCAMKDGRIFCTTNPDSPFHWFKQEYIDNNPDVLSWQFTLEDNPQLTRETKDYLSRQYKGVWFQRFILGNWVQASGAIFDFFDLSIHVINNCPYPATTSIVGIDYGTTNPTSFIMVCHNPHKYPNMWVQKEYYWDSREKQRQKTDSEYAEDLKAFLQGTNVSQIYCDPSASSFKKELSRLGITTKPADNEVLEGIRYLSTLFTAGTLKIFDQCQKLLQEIQSYTWDPRSTKIGEDKPLKQCDHAIDALRYAVYTHFSKKPIEKIDWDKQYHEAMGTPDYSSPLSQPPASFNSYIF